MRNRTDLFLNRSFKSCQLVLYGKLPTKILFVETAGVADAAGAGNGGGGVPAFFRACWLISSSDMVSLSLFASDDIVEAVVGFRWNGR